MADGRAMTPYDGRVAPKAKRVRPIGPGRSTANLKRLLESAASAAADVPTAPPSHRRAMLDDLEIQVARARSEIRRLRAGEGADWAPLSVSRVRDLIASLTLELFFDHSNVLAFTILDRCDPHDLPPSVRRVRQLHQLINDWRGEVELEWIEPIEPGMLSIDIEDDHQRVLERIEQVSRMLGVGSKPVRYLDCDSAEQRRRRIALMRYIDVIADAGHTEIPLGRCSHTNGEVTWTCIDDLEDHLIRPADVAAIPLELSKRLLALWPLTGGRPRRGAARGGKMAAFRDVIRAIWGAKVNLNTLDKDRQASLRT